MAQGKTIVALKPRTRLIQQAALRSWDEKCGKAVKKDYYKQYNTNTITNTRIQDTIQKEHKTNTIAIKCDGCRAN